MIHDSESRTAESRRSPRVSVEAPVTLRLETNRVAGTSDNLSEAGLMFFTDEPVRCVVEIVRDGETRTRHGRIVRVQRMSESHTGLAIEFED